MTIKFLYDYIDPNEGIIPNIEPIFGEYPPSYNLLFDSVKDKKLLPSYFGAEERDWFYPVIINRACHHVDDLIISDIGEFDRLTHFTRKIPKKVMQGLIENRGWILLIFTEPMGKEYQDMLLKMINTGRVVTRRNKIIPYDRFIVNLQSHEISHKNFFTLTSEPNLRLIKIVLEESFSDMPRKNFMCFNYSMNKKDHFRRLVFEGLKKTNLLDEGYVSGNNYNNIFYPETICNFVDINLAVETSQKIISNKNHPDSLHLITEKSYRSFLNKKPFLLFGLPNTLKKLRDKGFKTYDLIFDESYDSIEDPNKRLAHIIRELQSWVNLPQETKENNLAKVQYIVNHNFNLITEYINDEFENKLLKVIEQHGT